jgi:hypothetical protein
MGKLGAGGNILLPYAGRSKEKEMQIMTHE